MALGDGFESCLEAGEWLDTVEVASLDKVGNQTLRFGPTYLNSYDHFEGSKSVIYFTRICPLRRSKPSLAAVCTNGCSADKVAVVTGDVMHSPIQCLKPEWNFAYDHEPDLAAKSRRKFLEMASERQNLILGSHFPLPSRGKVVAKSDAFAWFED